jgi:hypothetical protein
MNEKETQLLERLFTQLQTIQTAVIELGRDVERLKRDRKDMWEYITNGKK